MAVKVSTEGELIEIVPQHQRSEEVSDIISRKLSFIVRNGILIFFCILFAIFVGCWFIQYPDIIHTRVRLKSINAPKAVIAKLSGKLVKLAVVENQSVAANQVIGYMESTGEPEQVIHLSHFLDSLSEIVTTEQTTVISEMKKRSFSNLGELQQFYQTFSALFSTFCNYLPGGFLFKKKKHVVYRS